MTFTLAHLSDVHLANVRKRGILQNFKGKRVIGGASWFLNRKWLHRPEIADAIQSSIIAERPDHVALTGDAVNIASWQEFPAAASWMNRFGPTDNLSFVPGNHDAYVKVPWSKGLAHFAPWMRPDRLEVVGDDTLFPYVRMRRSIALVGINSGAPQSLRKAGGTLGDLQLRNLRHVLALLGQQGFFRVVMIHHPPLPNLCPPRKALVDAEELQAVLVDEGSELVLHGHNHKTMINWLETKSGPTPVVGAPSASIEGKGKHENAGWLLYTIKRLQGRWSTQITAFQWDSATKSVKKSDAAMLSPPSGATTPS